LQRKVFSPRVLSLVMNFVGTMVLNISFLFGPVRGYHRMGPQCLLTPPVLASSIYAAVVYVSGGQGQFVISGVLLLPYPVSCVNLSMLSLILSFFLSLGGPKP
jgi:hypothetical protein